jgi:hypothetical protein
MITIDSSTLPMVIKIKGDHGNYVKFILRAAGRKLGAQLVKFDPNMVQLLQQN